MPSLEIRLAQETDNAALLRLTRDCPVEGPVSFCQERDPRFFTLNELQGDFFYIFVAEAAGRIIGSISLSRRRIYLDGRQVPAWYIGDLKIAPAWRGKGVLKQFITRTHRLLREKERGADLGLNLIAKSNPAVRILTGDRPYLPRFVPLGTVRNYAVHFLFRKKESAAFEVRRAGPQERDEIPRFLGRHYARRQFAPVVEPETFWEEVARTPGLGPGKFYVAKNNGKLAGVAAAWDQQAFKRIRVLALNPRVRLTRPFYNLAVRPLGLGPIPPPGSVLSYFHLSDLAVEGDDPEIFRALLVKIHNDYLGGPYLFFTVSLLPEGSLQKALRGFWCHTFDSLLFAVMPHDSPWHDYDFSRRPLYADTALT